MKPSNKHCRLAAALVCLVGLFVPAYGGERPAPPISWVELGPAGRVVARVMTVQSSCPSITLDGQPMPMQARAKSSTDFPILVCEAAIPTGATAATVEGQPLALPKTDPQRIVVIGDTGCRMKRPSFFQACNDPDRWPFAKVAGNAASWKPDLVIHVGDYLYREAPCPANKSGCSGSPWGDNWLAWNADFFTPAAPLLQTAPWIVVRGNHESCSRAGEGWFRLLDPRPAAESCQEITEPYAVKAGPQQFLVLDSAAMEEAVRSGLTETYEDQFAALRALAPSHAWLLVHHPLGFSDTDNNQLRAAKNTALPAGIDIVLSGHAHLFGLLSTSTLTQVVVGNSGATLHRKLAQALKKKYPQGMAGATATAITEFGFVTIEQTGGSWTWTARDVNGAVLTTCRFDTPATCTP